MNITESLYFSSFIKSFSSLQLKTAHPLPKIINIIEIKNAPPIIFCIIAILKIPHSQPYLHNKDIVPEPRHKYIFVVIFIDFLYTVGLCFYFSGIFLIIITDYMPYRYSDRALIRVTVGIALNILTGGLGTILYYNYIFKIVSRKEESCITKCFGYFIFGAIIEFGGIVCFAGTLFCIFYSDFVSKACKIAFPICYSLSVFMTISYASENDETNIGSCQITKKPNNKIEEYQIIEIDN